MNNDLLKIDLEKEKEKIIAFIKKTFAQQKIEKAVIGISGGIDSATSFSLLTEALGSQNIIIAHMYYFESKFAEMEKFVKQSGVPQKNIHHLSIKEPVDSMIKLL